MEIVPEIYWCTLDKLVEIGYYAAGVSRRNVQGLL